MVEEKNQLEELERKYRNLFQEEFESNRTKLVKTDYPEKIKIHMLTGMMMGFWLRHSLDNSDITNFEQLVNNDFCAQKYSIMYEEIKKTKNKEDVDRIVGYSLKVNGLLKNLEGIKMNGLILKVLVERGFKVEISSVATFKR